MKKLTSAFTLIELIIVIAIIAILSTLGLSTYNSVQQEARNSKRKADLKELKAALESYQLEHNSQYPSTGSKYLAICTTTWNSGTVICQNDYIPGLAPDYIDQLPRDPRVNKANTSSAFSGCKDNSDRNTYMYISDGARYKIIASCAPEGTLSPDDPFFDPCRPDRGWQISSDPSVKGVLNAAGTGCDSGTGW